MHYGLSSNVPHPIVVTRLVEAHGLAHSGFDVQGLDVLPILLE